MKRHHYFSISTLMFVALLAAGCAKPVDSSPPAAPPVAASNANTATVPSVVTNTNPQVVPPEAAPADKAKAQPPKLIGTYTISEVEHKGAVTMIPATDTTQITFNSDNSFVRVSKRKGRQNFSDSGQYRLEAPDRLVLVIQLSRNQIQVPPVEKPHTYTLSADGEELRLKGKDGKTALFRRTARPG